MTGQPGSGKTTLANKLSKYFGDGSFVIDGDDLRDIFTNKDYSEVGRRRNIERAQDIAQFLSSKGFIILVSLVSPYKDQRDEFKKLTDVVEIYLHTTEDRGRNHFHVKDYQAPTEDYVYLDTTNKTEEETYNEMLKIITNE